MHTHHAAQARRRSCVRQAAQLAIALHGPDSLDGQSAARRDAANLLRLMDSANTTIEQAHAAARDFCAMILVCRGAA